jgi:AcrR family transcriptional regulator
MTALPPPPADEGLGERLMLALPDQAPGQRADAVRNRARLLEAAERLVAEHGVRSLTMDAVASAACVGKGTVFRRFGDRTGLLQALLDRAEQQFQHSFLSGPPPLGPGAPPARRLHAFGVAALRHDSANLDLYLAAQPDPTRRFLNPPYRVRLTHVTMLLRETGASRDPELLGQTLMANLDIALVSHLLTQRRMPLARLERHWRDVVVLVTPPAD